jgi:hypothetical protein
MGAATIERMPKSRMLAVSASLGSSKASIRAARPLRNAAAATRSASIVTG